MNVSKIILNNDGSIKLLTLPYYIQQGSNLVDELDFGIVDLPSETTAIANFLRPNGTISSLTGVATNISDDDGTTYNGFKFVLTSAETLYEGEVKVSIKIYDKNDSVLYSYAQPLTINPSVSDPNEQTITLAQYNSLVKSLLSYQLKYAYPNVRYYDSMDDFNKELKDLAVNQIALVFNGLAIEILQKCADDEAITLDIIGVDSEGNDITSDYVGYAQFTIKKTDIDSFITLTLLSKSGTTLFSQRIDIEGATHQQGGLMSAKDKVYFDTIPNKIASTLEQSKAYTDSKVSSTYRFKGSVETYQDLPTTDNEIGDTWNVVEPYGEYSAGTNFAWTGNGWDALGGTFVLDYMTDSEVHEITGVRVNG